MITKSTLAPEFFPDIPIIPGVKLASKSCGIRDSGKLDVLLVDLAPSTTVAGVFTKSKTASAPVDWCKKCLTNGKARALIANSGNANAFTGAAGVEAVNKISRRAAEIMGSHQEDIFMASTGVIGEVLPDDKIRRALNDLHANLGQDWITAAQAICTTDTYSKGSYKKSKIDSADILIGGIAKGSGMIAPDMATMLAFIFTNASIPNDILQELLGKSVDQSFNAITVDSDTSTSDTVLLFATGQAKHDLISNIGDTRLKDFRIALDSVLLDLAHQIVRDGEGATKFIEIKISGASDNSSARKIGLAIANSPLVKTAIAGEDANWGRIVMAVGKSGEKVDRDKLVIRIGGIKIASKGMVVENYDEGPVTDHMKGKDIEIDVNVGVGDGLATVWTCDLTHGYISINADYRT